MQTLEAIGQQRFSQGISYTFAVVPTGRVYEGHGVGRLGAHTGGRNSIARAICWIGNYDVNAPTPQMIESTAQLLVYGWRSGWWIAPRLNGGHQQAPGASTACPGRNAMAAIPAINARAAALVAGSTQFEEDDMAGYDRDEVVGRLDRLIVTLDNVFRTTHAVNVGVNDPTSGARAVVLELAGRDPVEVDADVFAAAVKPLLAEAVREGMAADNEAQADEIVDRLAARLANPTS